MLREVNHRKHKENAFDLFGNWGLVVAGDENGYDAMTIGWGTMGRIWNKDIVTIYVRPHRYTREFIDKSENFSLCFFEEKYRETLAYFGTKSGREEDKAKACGFTPVFENGCPHFEEARLVIECRKLSVHEMDPSGFIDESLHQFYPDNDYHRVYVGEITRLLAK